MGEEFNVEDKDSIGVVTVSPPSKTIYIGVKVSQSLVTAVNQIFPYVP